ncbi:MAG: zinc ribbon domain-containing protein [Solobacterium sp.]|nr:zinc ribbon domain-containing protein [Solobacterium sp.]
MICKNCGADIQDDAVYCTNCGIKLDTVVPEIKEPETTVPVSNEQIETTPEKTDSVEEKSSDTAVLTMENEIIPRDDVHPGVSDKVHEIKYPLAVLIEEEAAEETKEAADILTEDDYRDKTEGYDRSEETQLAALAEESIREEAKVTDPGNDTSAEDAAETVQESVYQADTETPDADEVTRTEETESTAEGGTAAKEGSDPAVTENKEETADDTPKADTSEQKPTVESPTKTKKKSLLPIILALLAVVCIIGFVIFSNMKKKYDQASEAYAQGDYSTAAELYSSLGGYKDAKTMHENALLWIDAQGLRDSAGKDPDQWTRAAEAFDLIDEESAADEAELCRNKSTYYTAYNIMADDPADAAVINKAMDLFKQCGGILDADEQIENCEHAISYSEAMELFSNGNWAEAYEIFSDLSQYDYKDADDLETESYTRSIYEQAEAALAEGHNYEAYKLFDKIDDMFYDDLPDLREKRDACILAAPASGVVYRNSAYSNNAVQLTINNSGYKNSYVKLYMGDNLVMTVFIREDATATFWLPAGTYRMNKAYGDDWFGTDDMFGDEGRYWKCSFGGSETFTLEAGYGYEISSGGQGTSISNSEADRDSF